MADEGGEVSWQTTVAILQGDNRIVDKPTLSEKLLRKPPFRFLHDVVSAVQRNAGFAPGLYSGQELDAKAIQDKEGKVAYLTKIINVVSMVLGENVPAKPLKIVAGVDAEATNIFLQMLGRACQAGDGADAVQRVLGGEAPDAGQTSKGRPSSRPSSQQPRVDEPPPREAAPSPEPPPAKAEKPRASASGREDGKPEKKASAKPGSKPSSKSKPPPPDEAPPPPAAKAPAPAAGSGGGPLRPQSARKAPPKLAAPAGPAPNNQGPPTLGRTDSNNAAGTPGAQRPGSAARRSSTNQSLDLRGSVGMGGGANIRPISLLEEGAGRKGAGGGGDSDDDVEVVHEQAPVALGPRVDGEQGVLVKNILEAEAQLKKAGADAAGDGEDGGGTGIILGRRKVAGGAAGAAPKAGDLNAIREMVQKLTQASHPLAKSMDFIAEDLENMQKEYRFWATERRMFADKLQDEQRMASDNDNSAASVADLDGQIKQARDRIMGLKAQVLRNDEAVARMLRLAVVGSGSG